jgi:hypothetical protein
MDVVQQLLGKCLFSYELDYGLFCNKNGMLFIKFLTVIICEEDALSQQLSEAQFLAICEWHLNELDTSCERDTFDYIGILSHPWMS